MNAATSLTQTTRKANSLADFRDIHDGEIIVVCGCGESLNEFAQSERYTTIGVNDVGRRFDPNYLVVVNPPLQFTGDRFRYVQTSRAEYVFTQLDNLGIPHPHIVKFRLGSYGGTDFSNPEVLHYTQNSPYIALCLAAQMGAKRIGLIGVDFTDHHFFAATGRHPLTGTLDRINAEYQKLGSALAELGVEIVNLSRRSRLTAFPKQDLAAFRVDQSLAQPPNYFTTWSERRIFLCSLSLSLLRRCLPHRIIARRSRPEPKRRRGVLGRSGATREGEAVHTGSLVCGARAPFQQPMESPCQAISVCSVVAG